MNRYKIKLSGNKLRVLSDDSCDSIDLDKFSVLKLEQKQNKIVFSNEEKIIHEIDFRDKTKAKLAYMNISKKMFNKNKKFIASLFLTKIILLVVAVVFIFDIFINLATSAQQRKAYEDNMQQQIAQQEEIQDNNFEMETNFDKAKGQGAPASEVFLVE